MLEQVYEFGTKARSGRYLNLLGITMFTGALLLPSPIATRYGFVRVEKRISLGTTAYLNGIRGAASLVVFAEHFLMAFHPHMLEQYGSHPRFLQLPGVRLLYSGSVSVSLFFIISGFSLSVQPLRAIHDRDWERLHNVVSSATFRRGVRLVLPAAAITFLVMIGVRFNLFEARYDGATDMIVRGPLYQQTAWDQFVDWLEYVLGQLIYPDTWLPSLPNVTKSQYASPLYTIPQELWSSLFLFLTIVGLSRVRPSVRLTVIAYVALLSAWSMRREISCFLIGTVSAEVHLWNHGDRKLPGARSGRTRMFKLCCWSFVLVIGIWLASIPHTHGSYGSSSYGYITISKIIPWNSNVYTLGAALIIAAIDHIPLVQAAFSSAFAQYLGDISFGLYLVHFPVLAGWGWKVVPLMWRLTGNHTEVRYEAGFCLAVVIVAPVVFWAADLCWRSVDVGAVRFARYIEQQVLLESVHG